MFLLVKDSLRFACHRTNKSRDEAERMERTYQWYVNVKTCFLTR